MTMRPLVKKCLGACFGLNVVLLLTSPLSHWVEFLTPSQPTSSGSITVNIPKGTEKLPARILGVERDNNPRYRNKMKETIINKTLLETNITILVELSGEFGNHLNHIAHGRIIQTMLLQDHAISSYMILRRNSNDEKYKRTQRQLKRCFPNLRHLQFHDPQSSEITSPKTLDRIQTAILGQHQAKSLILDGGATFNMTTQAVQILANQVNQPKGVASVQRNETRAMKGVSFPFILTKAMINRDMMDKFYDDLRAFFDFDEEACCIVNDLPDPNVTVFHFRNFLGELKRGKSMGLEELSAHQVATEVFARPLARERKSIAIATRFPGHSASEEYYNALVQEDFDVQWLTKKDSNTHSHPSAMQDFCAMRRTIELVGMVRSTFVVWAALLGNPNGKARLYSVDSIWTRKKFGRNGKPIFRYYNWTHPELQRRIHFELYKAEEGFIAGSTS